MRRLPEFCGAPYCWRAVALGAVLAVAAWGCRSTAAGRIGAFPALVEAKNVTAEELRKMVELGDDEKYRIRRVAEMPGAEVHVIHTTDEIKPYIRKKHDQVFFVVSGRCISEVQGIRDIVDRGSVVIVPRGYSVRFVRADEDAGKRVLLVLVSLPNDGIQDRVEVTLPKRGPKEEEGAEKEAEGGKEKEQKADKEREGEGP